MTTHSISAADTTRENSPKHTSGWAHFRTSFQYYYKMLNQRADVGVPQAKENTKTAPAQPIAETTKTDTAMTMESVQALFEELVRPALQDDGGDVTIVEIVDNDVYVRLQGACTSCPSANETLYNGIARLLRDEFPSFGELIDMSDYEMDPSS
jgi:Fe-S cluster biogenesis protein NfuA